MSVVGFAFLSWLVVANSIGKRSVKVDEKLEGTKWPTFSLELQTILAHLCCDELIVQRKARPDDPPHAYVSTNIIAPNEVATWEQHNKVAMAALHGST